MGRPKGIIINFSLASLVTGREQVAEGQVAHSGHRIGLKFRASGIQCGEECSLSPWGKFTAEYLVFSIQLPPIQGLLNWIHSDMGRGLCDLEEGLERAAALSYCCVFTIFHHSSGELGPLETVAKVIIFLVSTVEVFLNLRGYVQLYCVQILGPRTRIFVRVSC